MKLLIRSHIILGLWLLMLMLSLKLLVKKAPEPLFTKWEDIPPDLVKISKARYWMSRCIYPTEHCYDVKINTMASQITGRSTDCLNVCSDAHLRQHHRSVSLAFVKGIYRWAVDSPNKGTETRKRFPFDDVIMILIDVQVIMPLNRQSNCRGIRQH